MNLLLWILQVLLALHTAVGAVWKFSNPAQSIPSLQAIPPAIWLALSVLEFFCSLDLLLPILSRRLGMLVPIAAATIAAEMLVFCGLHVASGDPNQGVMTYWLVTAAFCAFIAYGRLKLEPLKPLA